MIRRITSLSHLPKDKRLKPVPCPSFKEARRLHRDKTITIYYYQRHHSKFPPLLFLEQPKPDKEPAAETAGSYAQMKLPV